MRSSKIQPFFLVAILLGAFLLAFYIFEPFLVALALAAVFSVVLRPLYLRVLRSLPTLPSVAALLTLLLCLVCVLVPLTLLGSEVLGETQSLYFSLSTGSSFLPSAVDSIQQFVRAHIPGMEAYTAGVPTSLDTYVREGLSWLVQHLGDAFTSVTSLFLNLLVFLFALYYFLRDGDSLKQAIIALSPLDDDDDRAIFARLEQATNSIIRGNLTIALVQGVQVGVALTLFGVPNPVLWGVVGALASLIPGIGTSLILLPSAAYLAFGLGDTIGGLGLFVWWASAVMLIDNTLGPHLVGRGARLHPLVVLLSVLGGVVFFGPAGVFFGPLAISFLFAILSVYSKPPKADAK